MEDKNVVAGEKEKAKLAEEKVYSIETMIKDWANEKATAEKTKTECIWVDLDYDKPETKNKKNQSRYRVDEKFKQQVGDIKNLAGATALDHKKNKLNDKEETLINTMGSPTHLATTCILEVTRNLTYTLSCGLKLSANFTANALFAQVQAGVELDLGVTREKGKQVRSSIEHKIERTVPGKHEAVCTLVAYGTPYKHEFTVAVELQGKVPVLFKNHVNYKDFKISRNDGGHKLQFIPIADIFQDLKTHNKLPKDLTCTIENGKVTCVIKGEYIVEKVTTEIVMGEERPLAGATVATQPANTNQLQENKPVTNPANVPSSFLSSHKTVGMRIPESLASHPKYQKAFEDRIRLAPSEVDELIKLVKLLNDPSLTDLTRDILKLQITKLTDGKVDPNYKAQLDWIEKNPDKVHMLPSKTELQKESIDIDIYQTVNNTNQNNNSVDEKDESSSESNEHKPTGP